MNILFKITCNQSNHTLFQWLFVNFLLLYNLHYINDTNFVHQNYGYTQCVEICNRDINANLIDYIFKEESCHTLQYVIYYNHNENLMFIII